MQNKNEEDDKENEEILKKIREYKIKTKELQKEVEIIMKLNKALNLKNEEINRLLQEKADMDLANQLFNDSSNEQIENLSKSLSILKEKEHKFKFNQKLESFKKKIELDLKNKYEVRKQERRLGRHTGLGKRRGCSDGRMPKKIMKI